MIAHPPNCLPEEPSDSPQAEIDTVQEARRMNFIKTNRLSRREAAEIPATFDPGPEFD